MAIYGINGYECGKKISFSGQRTELNTLKELKNGEKPIRENKAENIRNALTSFSTKSRKESIEELLDILDNLKYGALPNSEFNDQIDKNFTDIQTGGQKYWGILLEDTINSAINGVKSDYSKDELRKKFEEISGQKKPLTDDQKTILKEREKLVDLIGNNVEKDDIDSVVQAASIRKNLNYFLISPNISDSQKLKSLSLMNYFFSAQYKINPQLKDKKLQILDEILNDMTISTPENPILTIKDVDQRQSGICAAISVCRKALAYEDKVRYLELILNELDDKDYIEVFDITNLKSGKKVKTSKADIDYYDAMKKGYRIIDASAHNWMQIGSSAGKGDINIQYYKAFDKEDYEVFKDSMWYNSLSGENEEKHFFLRCAIKEREALENLKNSQDTLKKAEEIYKNSFTKDVKAMGEIKENLVSQILTIFPDLTKEEARKTTTKLINFYKSTDENGVPIIHPKMDDKVKDKLIFDFFKSTLKDKNISDKKLLSCTKSLRESTGLYIEIFKRQNRTNELSTPKSRYQYNKKLFDVATAHRLSVEADLNIPDSVSSFEQQLDLPTRNQQILNHLNKNITELGKTFGNDDEIEKKSSDMMNISVLIPSKYNEILKTLTNKDEKTLLNEYIETLRTAIQNNEKDVMSDFALHNNIKSTRQDTIGYLNKLSDKLNHHFSQTTADKVIRAIGYDDEADFVREIYNNSLFIWQENGIREQEMKKIEDTMQLKFPYAIKKLNSEITDLENMVEEIAAKNQIPSRKDVVLRKLELKGFVLTRQKLNLLNNKFNSISDGIIANNKIKNPKERSRRNNELFNFSQNEKEIFKAIEAQTSKICKYINNGYKEINNELKPELDELYEEIGRLQGHFWMPEEGGSGLYTNQILRIIEQMTGKPYYNETDLQKAVETIKEGNSSGISSTHVHDSEFSMHAQYVAGITQEVLKNNKTGRRKKQDVLWHDNSWGSVEGESSWLNDGFRYTDYGGGYGGKNGYLLKPDYTTGTPVNVLENALGHSEKYDEDYPLFNDIVLQGTSPQASEDLYELLSYVCAIGNIDDHLDSLEKSIRRGKRLNIAALRELDYMVQDEVEKIHKRIKNEIKTEADFEALSDDDPLKMYINKLALYMSVPFKTTKNEIDKVSTTKEMTKFAQQLFDDQADAFDVFFNKLPESCDYICMCCYKNIPQFIDEINKITGKQYTEEDINEVINKINDSSAFSEEPTGSLDNLEQIILNRAKSVAKEEMKETPEKAEKLYRALSKLITSTIDKDVRIKSFDSPILKENEEISNYIIKAFDRHFKPKSDEELLKILQSMQNADFDEYDKKTSWYSMEDVGMHFVEPREYIKKLHSQHIGTEEELDKIITGHVISKFVKENSLDEKYRQLYVLLSDLDVDRYIKNFKEQAFTKYHVRPAFPKQQIFSDEKLDEITNKFLKTILDNSTQYNDIKLSIPIIDTCNDISKWMTAQRMTTRVKEKENSFKIGEEKKKELEEKIRLLIKQTTDIEEVETIHQNANEMLVALKNKDWSTLVQLNSETRNFFKSMTQYGVSIKRSLRNSKEETLLNINDITKKFVMSNITPNHQDEVFAKIKELTQAVQKEDENRIETLADEIHDKTIKYHITREPVTLLNTYIKHLQEKTAPKEVREILKFYLTQAIKTAELTQIEYKLVKNANKGYSTKTKDMFKNFRTISDKGHYGSITDSDGIKQIINLLRDDTNNDTTLRLFLTQTGLTEEALNAVIDSFSIDKHIEFYNTNTKSICQQMRETDNLLKITKNYFDGNQMQFNNFNAALEQLKKYLSDKNQKNKDSSLTLTDRYIEYINELEKNEDYKSQKYPPKVINIMLHSLNLQLIQTFMEEINDKIEELKEACESEESTIDLINSFEINPDSGCNKKREEFSLRVPELDEAYQKSIEQITDYRNKLKYLDIC